MAPEAKGNEEDEDTENHAGGNGVSEEHSSDDEEEEDEEPRLKYASMTKSLGAVYRNGDATSAFLVSGDKMINGTHNGNIHVLSLPSFQSLRIYHAHSASITSVSISPFPPPLPSVKRERANRVALDRQESPRYSSSNASLASSSLQSPKQQQVPPIASNSIHIATSSIDGHVCVASLVDPTDVLLRNFGRPVQAVAISPDYKNDRTYLSGGLGGNLVLTVGGRPGTTSTSNTVGGATVSASGWLGAIGLGSNTGKDYVLHSGEGSISTIKWSLSGKYVVWTNEQGIKIMRSNLHLETADAEFAWKRVNHIDRPNTSGWEEMAGVWKARAEWINEAGIENDNEASVNANGATKKDVLTGAMNTIDDGAKSVRVEKLLVGWGGTIWIIDVCPGGSGVGKEVGERKIGRVEVVTILRTDCIISGVSLYTPNLLLVLAYITPEEGRSKSSSAQTAPKRGVHRRQNALQPEMRIIDITTKEEVCVADTLHMSRFESLSATDYHLGVLPVVRSSAKIVNQRGVLEAIGGGLWDATMYPTRIIGNGIWDATMYPTRAIGSGIWDATMYPTRLFSSAASVRSGGSNSEPGSSSKAPSGIVASSTPKTFKGEQESLTATLTQGMKIFIHSPYDCVLATRPTLSDHFTWLDTHELYEDAWKLLDNHPEAISGLPELSSESESSTPTKAGGNFVDLAKAQGSLVEFFADDASEPTTSANQKFYSQVEKEKRRIGEKWLQLLVNKEDWVKAGVACSKVLGASSSWEHWIWVFAHAEKFDEIAPFIPTIELHPPLPSVVYEVVLGHYISHDPLQLKELLNRWPQELFDVGSITSAIRRRLDIGDIREETIEDGEVGRDWRILKESLAKLYLMNGRAREALKCFIQLQDAEAAMDLIKDHHLVDAVSDDIPGLILLRVSKEQQQSASLAELQYLTSEPVRLLVDEAHHGIVRPETVITQLQDRKEMLPYLFFYIRALWNGDTTSSPAVPTRNIADPSVTDHLAATEGKSLVNDSADIAVSLFAEYDRPLLMSFLRTSQSYTIEKASEICKKREYIPELVYLLSKEGQTNAALFLIIDKLQDVSQAIAFAKEQDDSDLWNDLLEYSMNKPRFIRGLLEEVGTAINPITLVRRIPEGLEVEGLKEGLIRMIKEYELQDSISEGVARVLRGEVATGMSTLRTGQKRGIKFEIIHEARPRTKKDDSRKRERPAKIKPGYCSGCGEAFVEDETKTVIGFPCGHTFHLSCMLTYDDEDEAQARPDESNGNKTDHAKALRPRAMGGCPIDVHKDKV